MSDSAGRGLSARSLNKKFRADYVLRDVSVDIRPGTLTALIGPNGSGKSTLLRALSLLEAPDQGEITIDGKSFRFPRDNDAEIASVWPDLTVVFQQLFLWPHLTARGNIMLALRGRSQNVDRAKELIVLFEMGSYVDRYPNQISLGQRQRVAIVRALALHPRYLLLDEVTSALDVKQTDILLEELARLRASGVGVLLVTHLIGFARQSADQVLFLTGGAVGAIGGPEILRSPTHPELAQLLSFLD